VVNTKPVMGSKLDFGCDPYVLGYWIGNGTSRDARITCHEDDFEGIVENFSRRGYSCSTVRRKKGTKGISFRVKSLQAELKKINQLKNKHIDPKWLCASDEQRLELVKGLMDSDGSVYKSGVCSFSQSNKQIVDLFYKLVCSLGIKATKNLKMISENNNYKATKPHWVVDFTPIGVNVFGLKRKADRILGKRGTHSYCDKRYIVDVIPTGEYVPMFCVEVDSADHTYLIGNSYIPTHNSSMASQCGLFFLALDNPAGNQISCFATKQDQARIVLDSARAMAKKNGSFLVKTGTKVLAHKITHKDSNSEMRAMSSESKSLDGLADVLAIMDELHSMSRALFDVVTSGMSKRNDSLTLCITTAGDNLDGVGFSQSAYAKKVALREIEDDQMFSIVYCAEETDDIYDETTWRKANPNYGVSVDPITFKAKALKAKEVPADEKNFKIKHLNMWVQEYNSFFDTNRWEVGSVPEAKLSDFYGKRCKIGVDIASHIDLTSIGYVFKEDGKYFVFDRSFIPEETVRKAKSTLYDNCIGQGFLTQTKGEAINQDEIRNILHADSKLFKVDEYLLDPWNAVALIQFLKLKGLNVSEFRMNVANLSEPTKKFDAAIREGKVFHNGSPLLKWSLGNVVVKYDAADNVFPRKSSEKLKIDPVIALLMAFASWVQEEDVQKPLDSFGIRFI
ncbi:hypothetical protein EKK58_10415, partial [Candidatus Dependentiae bacterium]